MDIRKMLFAAAALPASVALQSSNLGPEPPVHDGRNTVPKTIEVCFTERGPDTLYPSVYGLLQSSPRKFCHNFHRREKLKALYTFLATKTGFPFKWHNIKREDGKFWFIYASDYESIIDKFTKDLGEPQKPYKLTFQIETTSPEGNPKYYPADPKHFNGEKFIPHKIDITAYDADFLQNDHDEGHRWSPLGQCTDELMTAAFDMYKIALDTARRSGPVTIVAPGQSPAYYALAMMNFPMYEKNKNLVEVLVLPRSGHGGNSDYCSRMRSAKIDVRKQVVLIDYWDTGRGLADMDATLKVCYPDTEVTVMAFSNHPRGSIHDFIGHYFFGLRCVLEFSDHFPRLVHSFNPGSFTNLHAEFVPELVIAKNNPIGHMVQDIARSIPEDKFSIEDTNNSYENSKNIKIPIWQSEIGQVVRDTEWYKLNTDAGERRKRYGAFVHFDLLVNAGDPLTRVQFGDGTVSRDGGDEESYSRYDHTKRRSELLKRGRTLQNTHEQI